MSQKNSRDLSDQYNNDVTIGSRKPLNSTVHLEPYDVNWPLQFAKLADRIREALGDNILLLEHVGSTSVEGLSAKPIIDILLVVPDSTREESYVPQLESKGFVLRKREPDWYEHRLLKSMDIKSNVHVFSQGCTEAIKMLSFRNWLRTNKADKQLYEETKHNLAKRTWKYMQNYADAKTAVIEDIFSRIEQ